MVQHLSGNAGEQLGIGSSQQVKDDGPFLVRLPLLLLPFKNGFEVCVQDSVLEPVRNGVDQLPLFFEKRPFVGGGRSSV